MIVSTFFPHKSCDLRTLRQRYVSVRSGAILAMFHAMHGDYQISLRMNLEVISPLKSEAFHSIIYDDRRRIRDEWPVK